MGENATTFAQRIRMAAAEFGAEFTADQLADQADIQTYADKARIYNTIRDLIRQGELERVGKGKYRRISKSVPAEKQEIMWRLVRARRTVTVEDLQELSGAGRKYCEEFLRRLVRRGVVKQHDNGNFQLIEDPVEMPKDDAKAERLRRIRAQKKEALEALDRAFVAINDARMAVAQMEEE